MAPGSARPGPWLAGALALVALLVAGALWSIAASQPALRWRDGTRLLAEQRYHAAVRALESAVNNAPFAGGPGYDDAAAHLSLSYGYLALRDTTRAVAVLPDAPRDPALAAQVDLQRGLIAAVAGDPSAATSRLRAVADGGSVAGAGPLVRAALWHLGEIAWAAGDPAADAAFARLTADPLPDTYTPAAWLRRAEWAARDDPAAAWRYLSAARAAPPASAPPARPDLHLAGLDLDEGLPPAVISDTIARLDADLRGVPAAATGGPVALDAYWGRAFAALEAWPQAARLLERAVLAAPTFADAHAYLGLAHERQGARALAEREYQTALRLAPDHDLARSLLARLLIVEQRYSEARPLLEAVLAHDPTNVVAHLDMAAWAQAQGLNAQAETELQAAEAQQSARVAAGLAGPDEAALNTPLLLAQFYLGPGGGARACAVALPAATRAVARRAGAEEYDALGWAQHLCGDDASARASLDRAVADDPTLAAAQYHRGMVLLALNDPAARDALEAAQDFDPQGIWDRRALAALVSH